MSKRILQIILFLIPAMSCISQSPTTKEVSQLHSIVRVFLDERNGHIPNKKITRRSEIILLFLEMDSSGKVADIHWMMDTRNRDSVSNILNRMKVENFKDWLPDCCKSKIVILPIASIGIAPVPKDSEYAQLLFSDFLWERQRPQGTLQENGHLIFLTTLSYY